MNRTVFVGDLSYFTNEVQLMQYVSTVGKVASVQILRGSCGESLLHGFVKYENEQGATRAVQAFHNFKFMGRRLIVNSTNTKAPKKPYHHWHKFTLHFTCTELVEVTEEVLDRLCSPFGEIGDAVVRSHVPLNPPEVGIAGYAVVFFKELSAAQRAFEYLNKATINNVTFSCSFSTQPHPPSQGLSRRAHNPNAMMQHEHLHNQAHHAHHVPTTYPPSGRLPSHPSRFHDRVSPPSMSNANLPMPPQRNITGRQSPSCQRSVAASPTSLAANSGLWKSNVLPAEDKMFSHLNQLPLNTSTEAPYPSFSNSSSVLFPTDSTATSTSSRLSLASTEVEAPPSSSSSLFDWLPSQSQASLLMQGSSLWDCPSFSTGPANPLSIKLEDASSMNLFPLSSVPKVQETSQHWSPVNTSKFESRTSCSNSVSSMGSSLDHQDDFFFDAAPAATMNFLIR